MTAVGAEQGIRTGIEIVGGGWELRRKSDPAPTVRPNNRIATQVNSELDSGLSPGSCLSPLNFHEGKGRKTTSTGAGNGTNSETGNSNRSASGSGSGNGNRIRGGSAGGQKNNGTAG